MQVDASSRGKARALIDELGVSANEQWLFEIHVASPLVEGASTAHPHGSIPAATPVDDSRGEFACGRDSVVP